MRRGEILGLTWDKVDLQQRMIFLDAGDTKDQEPRRIPINSELLEILKAVPSRLAKADEDRHVFQFNGKSFLDMRDALRKACKTAKIKYGRFRREGFIFHDLRHTFTTNARRAGVPEREIMAITGHTSRSTFDRYSTVDDNDLRRAVRRLEQFSAGQVSDSVHVTHEGKDLELGGEVLPRPKRN